MDWPLIWRRGGRLDGQKAFPLAVRPEVPKKIVARPRRKKVPKETVLTNGTSTPP